MRKRPVVQLTALLDLLFIIIFIGLTASLNPPADGLMEQLQQEENKQAILTSIYQIPSDTESESESDHPVDGQFHYRRLFVSNNYYGKKHHKYVETLIYSGDDKHGLWPYRINLHGAGLFQKLGGDGELTLEDIGRAKVCTEVELSRERIRQKCKIIDTDYDLDCERHDQDSYYCIETTVIQGKKEKFRQYKMELIRIYDKALI